jgi:hypothetical protein
MLANPANSGEKRRLLERRVAEGEFREECQSFLGEGFAFL